MLYSLLLLFFYFFKYSFLFCCLQVDSHMRWQGIFIFVFPMGTWRCKGTKTELTTPLLVMAVQDWRPGFLVSKARTLCSDYQGLGSSGTAVHCRWHDGPLVRESSEAHDPRTEPWKQLADRIMTGAMHITWLLSLLPLRVGVVCRFFLPANLSPKRDQRGETPGPALNLQAHYTVKNTLQIEEAFLQHTTDHVLIKS